MSNDIVINQLRDLQSLLDCSRIELRIESSVDSQWKFYSFRRCHPLTGYSGTWPHRKSNRRPRCKRIRAPRASTTSWECLTDRQQAGRRRGTRRHLPIIPSPQVFRPRQLPDPARLFCLVASFTDATILCLSEAVNSNLLCINHNQNARESTFRFSLPTVLDISWTLSHISNICFSCVSILLIDLSFREQCIKFIKYLARKSAFVCILSKIIVIMI